MTEPRAVFTVQRLPARSAPVTGLAVKTAAPAEIAAGLEGRSFQPPTGADRTNLMIEHYEAMLSFYGADLGVRVSRKHLGWWLERMPGGAVVRQKVMRMTEPGDVIDALKSEALHADRVAA